MTTIGSTISLAPSNLSLDRLDLAAQREEAIIRGIVEARVKMLQTEYGTTLEQRNQLYTPGASNDDVKSDLPDLPPDDLDLYNNGLLYEQSLVAKSALKKYLDLENQCKNSEWINVCMIDVHSAVKFKSTTEGISSLALIQKAHNNLQKFQEAMNAWYLARDQFESTQCHYENYNARLYKIEMLLGNDPIGHPDVSSTDKTVRDMQQKIGLGSSQKIQAALDAVKEFLDLREKAKKIADTLLQTEKEVRWTHRQLILAEKILSKRLPAVRYISELLLKDNSLTYEGPYKKEVEHYIDLQRTLGQKRDNLRNLMFEKMALFKNMKIELRKLGIDETLNVVYISEIRKRVDNIWRTQVTPILEWLELAKRVELQQSEATPSLSL